MVDYSYANPFTLREVHDARAVTTYRVMTILTWLLSVVCSIYYTFEKPHDDHKKWRNTIWGVNRDRQTGFSLNALIASLYWLALFLLQVGYVWHLFAKTTEFVQAAAAVGSHFIYNNLLHFGFVMLFVRGHFWWAELLLVVNFFNLTFLYFRHNTKPRFVHAPVASWPLAWTFVALYWNGAIAVHANSLAARILANIAIWGILVYGLFFLLVFKDYTMGFALSVLTASLGVGQFLTKAIAFQWIFAFAIMATLFVVTVLVGAVTISGKEINLHGDVVPADTERAPLLDGN